MHPIEYILATIGVVGLGLAIIGILFLDLRVIGLGLFAAIGPFVVWRLFVANKVKK